jgi:hypothetical protein
VLTIFDRFGALLLRRNSSDGGLTLDLATRRVTWAYTPTESRMIPLGALCRYELERWIGGTQETWVYGSVTGAGGNNVDV